MNLGLGRKMDWMLERRMWLQCNAPGNSRKFSEVAGFHSPINFLIILSKTLAKCVSEK
ncbi:hypothetical protein D9M68_493750 [compost metagenome]